MCVCYRSPEWGNPIFFDWVPFNFGGNFSYGWILFTTTTKNYIPQKMTKNSSIFSNIKYTFYIHLWLTYNQPSHLITQFNVAQPSKQLLKLLVLFSGFCPPKLSFSPAINPECASWSVLMENDSLGERELDNENEKFGHSSLGSFSFLGPSGCL